MASSLGAPSLDSWGWRVPFVLGLAIAPAGYFLRPRVGETPRFKAAEAGRRLDASPIRATFTTQWPALLIAAGSTIVWTAGGYTFLTFLPVFATQQLGIAPALGINGLAAAVRIGLTPVMGALSDRIGRKPTVLTTAPGFLLLTYPMFVRLTAAPGVASLLGVQLAAALLMAIFSGPGPFLPCELFPLSVRTTGLSVGYNLVTAAFGGFAPFIGNWLARETGQKVVPSYFVVVCAAMSLMAILLIHERSRDRDW